MKNHLVFAIILFVFLLVGIIAVNDSIARDPNFEECKAMCAEYFQMGSEDYYDCVYCCNHDCSHQNRRYLSIQ